MYRGEQSKKLILQCNDWQHDKLQNDASWTDLNLMFVAKQLYWTASDCGGVLVIVLTPVYLVWYICDMCLFMCVACGLTYTVAMRSCLICMYVYRHVHMHWHIFALCPCTLFYVPTQANIPTLCVCVPKAWRQVGLPQARILPQRCQTKAPQRAQTLGRQAHWLE